MNKELSSKKLFPINNEQKINESIQSSNGVCSININSLSNHESIVIENKTQQKLKVAKNFSANLLHSNVSNNFKKVNRFDVEKACSIKRK